MHTPLLEATQELHSRHDLSDGTPVALRPISPHDYADLVDFHADLSPLSRYYRFFNYHPHLSHKEVTHFVNVDHLQRVALVASHDDRPIAIARFERLPGSADAEVAFVVIDDYQGRGLGKVLMANLIDAARRRGITRLTASVLPDNYAMLHVMQSTPYPVTSRFSGGVVELTLDLS